MQAFREKHVRGAMVLEDVYGFGQCPFEPCHCIRLCQGFFLLASLASHLS